MPLHAVAAEFGLGPRSLRVWRVLVRYVAPAAVAMVLMGALMAATS